MGPFGICFHHVGDESPGRRELIKKGVAKAAAAPAYQLLGIAQCQTDANCGAGQFCARMSFFPVGICFDNVGDESPGAKTAAAKKA